VSDSVIPKFNCGITILLVAAGLVTSAVPSSLGQAVAATTPFSPVDAPYVPSMKFDVASVRQSKAEVKTGQGDGFIGSSFTMTGQFVPHTTRLRLIDWPAENLIGYAYGLEQYQIVGAPKWPWPTTFVIQAESDSVADAMLAALPDAQQKAEQRHMLQVLLEERFNLKTHWETRQGDVYNLVVAKGGSKLGAEGSIPPSAKELKMVGDHPLPTLLEDYYGHEFYFDAHGCSMDQWAERLASRFERPVINRTELMGKYDFVLKYKGRWDRERSADDSDPTPPLDRALQEELGLKVEAVKGPVKVLVIDHIEKPSEN